jgi:hypothetical protein
MDNCTDEDNYTSCDIHCVSVCRNQIGGGSGGSNNGSHVMRPDLAIDGFVL